MGLFLSKKIKVLSLIIILFGNLFLNTRSDHREQVLNRSDLVLYRLYVFFSQDGPLLINNIFILSNLMNYLSI